jgi:hypothetical protein
VLAVLYLAAVLVVLGVLGTRSVATSEPGDPVRTRVVEVAEGDTLWSIAGDVAGPGEIRDVVYEIRRLNGMSGSGLAEGQRLTVPLR